VEPCENPILVPAIGHSTNPHDGVRPAIQSPRIPHFVFPHSEDSTLTARHVLHAPLRTPALGTGLLTQGVTDKHRANSSSALLNSKGRRTGAPKQTFPPLRAGGQNQPFSTRKERNTLIRRRAKAGSRRTPLPPGSYILLSTRSTVCELNSSEAARISEDESFCFTSRRDPI
jgi:hypothetical protein